VNGERSLSESEIMDLECFLGKSHEKIYVYRKSASILSISIPIAIIALYIRMISDKGIDDFVSFVLSGSFFGAYQILGAIALAAWILRYSVPAFSILLKTGFAIYRKGKSIFFAGNEIPLEEISHFEVRERYINKNLCLVTKDGTELKISQIFIQLV